MTYVQIIVDIAHSAVDQLYTYRIPEGMRLLPGMRVRVYARDGVLPRKTFSMGESVEKRYYLEARKIR